MPKIALKNKIDKETIIHLHLDLLPLTKSDEEIRQLAQCAAINSLLLNRDFTNFWYNPVFRKNKYFFSLSSIFDFTWTYRNWQPKEASQIILLAISFVRANEIYENLTPVEKLFINLIDQVEMLLQEEFLDYFLPFLTDKEKLILEEIQKILSTEEEEEVKIQNLTNYFNLTASQWQNDIFIKIEELLAYILNIHNEKRGEFGWQPIPPAILDKEKKRALFGYNSNISAFFFNDLRRLKEQAVSQLLSTRAVSFDWSFNRNVFKLSVLSHLRGFFRALVFQSSKNLITKYKLFVPSFVLPTLKTDGITSKFLLKTLTVKQWFAVSELDGLGLHHNSQEYYYPVIDD